MKTRTTKHITILGWLIVISKIPTATYRLRRLDIQRVK
jgi:hypothetical protein